MSYISPATLSFFQRLTSELFTGALITYRITGAILGAILLLASIWYGALSLRALYISARTNAEDSPYSTAFTLLLTLFVLSAMIVSINRGNVF